MPLTLKSKEYLDLLNEKERQHLTFGLTRGDEIHFAARLDRLWAQLSEDEQAAIEERLTETSPTAA